MMDSISPLKFYGCKIKRTKFERKQKNSEKLNVRFLKEMPKKGIMEPKSLWKEFNKQAAALEAAVKESSDDDMLCTFAYQRDDGTRKFVVTYPKEYWWYYKNRPPEKRCSYEVIPDGAPCWLYLDLEFLIELNPESNGPRMTNTFIDILCKYYLKHWNLICNKYKIVNLDSTNNEKFSRHLIFATQNIAFKNNLHAGRFVKFVCTEIESYINFEDDQHIILNDFNKTDIKDLFVNTKSGKKLFVDLSVYSRNRQFRIYKSTKWGKQSYLEIAPDSKYVPPNKSKDEELNFFLNSLISYFSNRKNLILYEFVNNDANTKVYTKKLRRCKNPMNSNETTSKYSRLDKYILNTIHPGKIRLCRYIKYTKTLIYEISGNRYCQNLGRWHKSNNIFWIVDLNEKVMYQKCHDPDCANFLSEPIKLPDEICFELDEETDSFLINAVISENIVE